MGVGNMSNGIRRSPVYACPSSRVKAAPVRWHLSPGGTHVRIAPLFSCSSAALGPLDSLVFNLSHLIAYYDSAPVMQHQAVFLFTSFNLTGGCRPLRPHPCVIPHHHFPLCATSCNRCALIFGWPLFIPCHVIADLCGRARRTVRFVSKLVKWKLVEQMLCQERKQFKVIVLCLSESNPIFFFFFFCHFMHRASASGEEVCGGMASNWK